MYNSTPTKAAVTAISLTLFSFPFIYYLERFSGAPGQIFTIPYRISILAAFIVLFVSANRFSKVDFQWYRVALALFLACYFLRLYFDLYLEKVYALNDSWTYFLYFFIFACTPFAVLTLSKIDLERVLHLTLSSGKLLAGLSVAMGLFYSRDLIGTHYTYYRSDGAINPITLGHMGTTLVLLVAGPRLINDFDNSLISRFKWAVLLDLALLCLGIATILLASTRSPVIALVACSAILLWKFGSSRLLIGLISLGAVGIWLQAGISQLFSRTGSSLFERFGSAVTNRFEDRTIIFSEAFDKFLTAPFFGASAFVRGDYPHNLLIEAFMATGMAGGVLFALSSGFAIFSGRKLLSSNKAFALVYVLFIQYSILGMSSGALWGSGQWWLLLLLTFAMLDDVESRGVSLNFPSNRHSGAILEKRRH